MYSRPSRVFDPRLATFDVGCVVASFHATCCLAVSVTSIGFISNNFSFVPNKILG